MLGYVTEPALSGGPAAACARRTLRSPRPPSAWLAGEPIRCGELLTRDDAALYSPYRSLFCGKNHPVSFVTGG